MEVLPLYWTDPDCLECETRVAEDASGNPDSAGGTSFRRIRLENCPFFPGGGGQAPDTGTVDGRELIKITRGDQGIYLEIAGSEPFIKGSAVTCLIDGSRRWQSRQQHSGQHMLSAALASEGLETVSVHLGEDYCGIEVNAEAVPVAVIERVLSRCDGWISPGRPINSLVISPADIEGRNLRRPLGRKTAAAGTKETGGTAAGAGKINADVPAAVDAAKANVAETGVAKTAAADNGAQITGDSQEGSGRTVRIIEIEGIDEVGCGGVHLNNTSSIRLILFAGSEKIRGHARLKWLIGEQAVKECRGLADQGRRIQNLLSVQPALMAAHVAELAAGYRAAQAALNSAEREIGRLMAVSAENSFKDGSSSAALALEGGQERLEGALEHFRGRAGEGTVFLAGGADSAGSAPWALLCGGADSGRFFKVFRESFLPEIKGKGGGGPPVMRGRMGIKPEDGVWRFERFHEEFKKR
jgi:Ser-tRNA(Ala) deacylase AlaX